MRILESDHDPNHSPHLIGGAARVPQRSQCWGLISFRKFLSIRAEEKGVMMIVRRRETEEMLE